MVRFYEEMRFCEEIEWRNRGWPTREGVIERENASSRESGK